MTQPTLLIDKKKRKKRIRSLYLCTIFPKDHTWQTLANIKQLTEEPTLDATPILIRAGEFSHRHNAHKQDPVQIQVRQMYLDKAPHDWLLILDSDEVLLGAGNIADWLDYLDVNEKDVGFLREVLPDGSINLRPRLIRNRPGLKYGGPNKKHDWIDYQGRNYIDVDTANGMDVGISFFHTKSADVFSFSVPEGETLKHPNWVYESTGPKITSFEELIRE